MPYQVTIENCQTLQHRVFKCSGMDEAIQTLHVFGPVELGPEHRKHARAFLSRGIVRSYFVASGHDTGRAEWIAPPVKPGPHDYPKVWGAS